jgi:DNA polymerase epsilon subunit 1
MDNDELLDLISCSSVMSRSLKEYDRQKSTAICTAKRLAEFLGSQMVEKKGLACQFIISRLPLAAPVAERAIPIAIFAAEKAKTFHFIRKWTKDPHASCELRDIVDWDYYIGRMAGTIQKIITIPAASQDISNPVPRIVHPDWLKQKIQMRQHTQRSLTDSFAKLAGNVTDNSYLFQEKRSDGDGEDEDVAVERSSKRHRDDRTVAIPQKKSRVTAKDSSAPTTPMPPESDFAEWLSWMKRKWRADLAVKRKRSQELRRCLDAGLPLPQHLNVPRLMPRGGVGAYLDQRTLLLAHSYWQIIQISETDRPGILLFWVAVQNLIQTIQVKVPRILYVHADPSFPDRLLIGKLMKCRLPRGGKREVEVIEVELDEEIYQNNLKRFTNLFSHPDIHGVYESQIPLPLRAVIQLGCVCSLTPDARRLRTASSSTLSSSLFSLSELQRCSVKSIHSSFQSGRGSAVTEDAGGRGGRGRGREGGSSDMQRSRGDGWHEYLQDDSVTGVIYVYFSFATRMSRGILGVFSQKSLSSSSSSLTPGHIFVITPTSTNREGRVEIEKNIRRVFRRKSNRSVESIRLFGSADDLFSAFQSHLSSLRKKIGSPLIVWQSTMERILASRYVPDMDRVPVIAAPGNEVDNRYPPIQWEVYAASYLVGREKESLKWFERQLLCARYAEIPVGNMESDHPIFISDILLARLLKAEGHILWYSSHSSPDLGQEDLLLDHSSVAQMVIDDFSRPALTVPKV